MITSILLSDHHNDPGLGGKLGREQYNVHSQHNDPEMATCLGLHDWPTTALGLELKSHASKYSRSSGILFPPAPQGQNRAAVWIDE